MSNTFISDFRESVKKCADKTALVMDGKALSYLELDAWSNQVACKIAGAGVSRGDIVTVHMPRSLETVGAVLGILKAGAAFCIIDSQYPADRVDFIRSDTGAKVQIDEAWMADLPDADPSLASVDPEETDPAVVIYTSGSTGTPKGVVNSHRSLTLAYRGFSVGRGSNDVLMSVASFSFIAGALEILVPLWLGATLHVADDEVRRDGALLVRFIHDQAITSTFLPPQMARFVLPRVEDQLVSLMVGSDRVSGLYSDKVRVYNTYGASETCGPVTSFLIDRPYAQSTPIGKPFAGSTAYVVDDQGRQVPNGEIGEICIAGQVASGYLNLPALTAERFVLDPFAADGSLMYRTNDLGRFDADGNLLYVQRRDWMIKVRGFRVEPGEVEAAIVRLAPVKQAVVKGFENAAGETSLFAVYTADSPVKPKVVEDAIRDFLPAYMIPAFMQQIDALPVNANGKVDRKSIEVPDVAMFRAPYRAPETTLEKRIVEAFETVLGVQMVGLDDDFNLLGGDSMLAARLQAELSDLKISAADVLNVATPAALAKLQVPKMQKAASRETWPLTFTERQMAAEQGMNPQSVSYNINSQGLRIRGPFDADRMQKALDALVARHPILRSCYPMEHGDYVHRILPSLSVPLERIDCRQEDTKAQAELLNAPFDLSQAPLFRAHLFVHGPEDVTLHFTFHHIIMDGGSWGTFISDLFALYNGLDLPEPALDYFDHAVFQAEHAQLGPGEAAFREMFADGVPETEMPTVAVRPEVLPPATTDISRRVPIEKIAQTAKKFGVTKYELMMAALGMTLARYTGTEDVVVGTAMSGRTMAEQENMIGMFVNTLPVRMQPIGDMHVGELVLRTANTIREVKKHQTYPIERLVPLLAPDRNASRSPLFDIIFNYLQKEPIPEVAGAAVEAATFNRQALAIDLMLEALVEDDNIHFLLSYSKDLYDDAIPENFMEQFLTILERLADSASDARVEVISELPDSQLQQILVDFAGNRTDANKGVTVTELFRAQAARTPDGRAVVFGGKELSYRQLDDITDRLAAHLASLGVGRGKVVGIMVNRGLMMPIASLGVLKTGAAYLPLDPAYPADRLEYMIGDASADLIIADAELMDRVPEFAGTWVKTEDIDALPAAQGSLEGPKPEDLFILLYTSGTTGKPKGVMLRHENLANFLEYYTREYELSERDNIPAYASFGFDACMMDMYPTLTSGACLHIIPEEMRLDLPGLRQYFEDNGITVAFMTTQLGRQFAERDAKEPFRALSIGGEALTPIKPPNFAFYNVYGPTECTILVTRFRVDRLYDRVPIGRALDNTALYVFDSRGHLSPVGVAGELGIAGRQVSSGYLNRPDLTAEKFVANPYSEDPDYARMYKTGDVVRFLPSGDIDFVGRRDFQVKIRGFRVELTEIEGRIREFPHIQDATVIAQEDAGGGKRIAAYIVGDEVIDISALNAFIAEKLPIYMVPAATMQIDRIPLNPNGKVDKRKLPKITIQAEEIVAPKTDLEREIAGVVAGVLGNDEFGVNTDLMYAGLNSLSAIKAAALITEATGKKLSTMELMREKTIERIARLLETGEAYEEKTFEKRAFYPLTQNQLGLYFALVKDPASLVYNIPFELTLSPQTDVERLQDSLRQVIDAHAYVKTHFSMRDNTPVQIRNDDAPVEIVVKRGSEEEYAAEKNTFVRPFNFFDGPLYDLEIFVTPEHVYLLTDFHHIIFDGGSMDIFLRDLEMAYDGQPVAAESFTSFDLALSETERGQDAAERAKEFYARRLADGEGATAIPVDKPGEGGQPCTVRAAIRKNAVIDAIRGMGITSSNLFLAATALVTGRFASTDDVRIASITNGREGVQVQNNLGMLVETLPTVLRPQGDLSAKDYLENVQREMIEVLQNRAYSYLQASSEYGYNAQILYAFQGGVLSKHALGGHDFTLQPFGIDRAKFPISVNIQEDDRHFTVEAEYDDAIFAEETMQAYASCIAHIAQLLAGALDTPLGELSICTPEQTKVIDGFNCEPEPVKGNSLFQHFERWARSTPDAPALVACDRSYTYRELNETANRLAHALIERGVHRGDKVAFMLPRTGNILVAMLGIMKTGAAYIPVDPEYPKERIEHILSDSAARCILTDGPRDLDASLDIQTLLGESSDVTNPDVGVRQDDLCYIIYTSGSTGKPKGVMIEHRNIMNYVTNVPANIPDWALTQNDCSMVSVTTVSFDMFLKEAFTTLMNGRRLILSDDAQSKNPDLLAALFAQTGGNAFNATPSRMLQYMELPEIREALAGCRVIMAGGEGYPAKLYEKLRAVTDAELINTYGPTEITVSCNAKILDSPAVTIGKPLYGVVEQVMDICGQPLPAGVTGELWIGGNGVGRGYLGNPEMTAERFVEWNGRRWYRSGDLARWTQTGEIRILGRNDGQIKLRGLRIELGEIESALLAIPGVKSGVVLVRQMHGQEHLSAYYTAETQIPPSEIRDTLVQTLTKYMVPTAYLQLESLPMTPNGKIDRKALPEAQLMRREEYVAPTNEREQAYSEIFADILGLDKVGITDSFFDLGGTSLLVTQVTIDAAERGFKISYGDVFANPTPKELAALGETEGAGAPDDMDAYDYTALHRLLEENTIEALVGGARRDLGNVCITGTTGFLGIHVLREFLRSEKGTAYCIVRGKTREDAEVRLKSLLVYYFSDSFDDLFGSRIQVVPGDVTQPAVFEKLLDYPIDTFINCAANVKHFSAGTDIEDVNVGGVRNAIDFCQKKNCRFIQISTASTAGMSIDGSVDENMKMNEWMLYFGQDLGNKYTHSKFLAERETLEAALAGLDAKIMRVGNLMAREEDGEFQANFKTNNFLGRIKAYSIIGRIPYADLGINAEFAPIDYTARAILALAKTPKENRVFHPYNDHSIYFADVLSTLKAMGIDIEAVESEDYEEAYRDAMHDKKKARHLNSLIAYQETGRQVRPVPTTNTHTSQALLRLGFVWPITTPDYLRNFFEMMDGLGFFDPDED